MTSPVLVDAKNAGPNDAFTIGYDGVAYSMLDPDTSHLTASFYVGYQDLYNVLSTQIYFNPSDPRMYWLQNAIEINSNNSVPNPADPQGLSNTFIRAVTANGLLYEGTASEDTVDQMVQTNSDTIGKYVLGAIDGYPEGNTTKKPQDLSQAGVIPGIDAFIQNDIGSALEKGHQSIQGWGGDFYFWNTPIAAGSSDTIGSQIYGSPSAYQEFLTINAKALLETVGASIQQSGSSFLNSVWSTWNALKTAYNTQTPFSVSLDILAKVVDLIEDGYDYPQTGPKADNIKVQALASDGTLQTAQTSDPNSGLTVLDSAQVAENQPLVLNVLPMTNAGVSSSVLTSGVNAPNALNGTVSIVNGQLVYTPNQDFVGSDFVSFTTSDGTSVFTSLIPVTVTGVTHDTVTQNADGSTTTLHFDATGTPSSSRTARADGSYDLTAYSTAGGQSYASSTQSYNAQGFLLSTTSFYVDGSVYQKAVPVTNADGSTGTDVYDRSGTLIQQTIIRTDGTKELIQNLSTARPYVTIESFYNSAGRLTSELFLNADGSTYQTGSVVLNASGSSVETFATPAGVVLGQKVTNTDGTSDVGLLGIVHQPWASTSSDYDVSGQLISKQLLRADGSIYLEGTAVRGPLGTTVTYAAPSGSLSAVETINSDGSSTIVVSNITGQGYITKTSSYDPSSQLTTETFGNLDGSQDVNQYAPNRAGSLYVASILHYDPTGLLASESDYNSDGSLSDSQQTVLDDDGSTTTTFKGADGKILKTALSDKGATTTTYYDGDGSPVSVQVSVAPGASYTGSADGLFVSTHWNSTVTLTGSSDQVGGSGLGAMINLAGANEGVSIDSATIALWDAASATVRGSDNAIEVGSEDALTVVGSDDTVTVQGDDSTVTMSGTGGSVDVASTDDTVSIASGIISLDDGATAAVNGDDNTILLWTGGGADVTGSNNDISVGGNSFVAVIGSDEVVKVTGAYSTVDMTGTGDSVTVASTDDTVSIASGIVSLDENSTASIIGDGNTVTLKAGDQANVTGSDDIVHLGDDASAAVRGDGDSIDLNGSGNGYVIVSGSGDTVSVVSTDDTVVIGSGTVSLGANVSVTVSGDGDGIRIGGDSYVAVTGSDDLVSITGASSTVTITGEGDTVDVESTDDTITIDSGTVSLGEEARASIDGDGNTVTLKAGDQANVTGSNDTVDLGDDSSAAVSGDSDSISLSAGSYVAVSGSGDIVSVTSIDDTVLIGSGVVGLGDNASAAVSGDSDSINLGANSYVVVTGSDDVLSITGAYSTASVTGSDDLVNITGAYSTANVTSSGATVSVTSTDDTVSIGSGTVTLSANARASVVGDGDGIDLGGNSFVAVGGSGDIVTLNQTGNTVLLQNDGQGVDTVQSGSVSVVQAADGTLSVYSGLASSSVMTSSSGPSIALGNGNVVSSIVVPATITGYGANGLTSWQDLFDTMSGALKETDQYQYNASNSLMEIDHYNSSGAETEAHLYDPQTSAEIGSYLYGSNGNVNEVVDLVNNHDWLSQSDGSYKDKTSGATSKTQPTLR